MWSPSGSAPTLLDFDSIQDDEGLNQPREIFTTEETLMMKSLEFKANRHVAWDYWRVKPQQGLTIDYPPLQKFFRFGPPAA